MIPCPQSVCGDLDPCSPPTAIMDSRTKCGRKGFGRCRQPALSCWYPSKESAVVYILRGMAGSDETKGSNFGAAPVSIIIKIENRPWTLPVHGLPSSSFTGSPVLRFPGSPVAYIIPSFLPCFSNAASALSQSARVRPAFIMVLMRDLSRATMGNTIGNAKTPSS